MRKNNVVRGASSSMVKEEVDVLTELGEFTGQCASLEECHSKGYWHRAVFCLIVNQDGDILLQRRSNDKKLWPNKWDVTVGGHVRTGEIGRAALIRECEEELGLKIKDDEVKFIVSSISKYDQKGYINNHFDEFYLIIKNVKVDELLLQKEEVEEAKYFTQKDLLNRIKKHYDGLTEKTVSWGFVQNILENNTMNELVSQHFKN